VQSFEQGAVDTVLEPAQAERLGVTVERPQRRLAARAAAAPLKWIQANVGAAIQMIPVDEALFFVSDEKYTRVQTATTEALIRKPIKERVEELDPDRFWQIHRSTLVNVNAIAGVTRDFRGRQIVSVKGHPQKLEVSRSYAGLFKGMCAHPRVVSARPAPMESGNVAKPRRLGNARAARRPGIGVGSGTGGAVVQARVDQPRTLDAPAREHMVEHQVLIVADLAVGGDRRGGEAAHEQALLRLGDGVEQLVDVGLVARAQPGAFRQAVTDLLKAVVHQRQETRPRQPEPLERTEAVQRLQLARVGPPVGRHQQGQDPGRRGAGPAGIGRRHRTLLRSGRRACPASVPRSWQRVRAAREVPGIAARSLRA
jgi:hypothetical protein